MCAIKLNLIKWNTKGKRQQMGNGFFENINTVKKNSYRHFSLMFEIISKMSDREQKNKEHQLKHYH